MPDGPGRIASGSYAVSHTDLPLRQCYYLGMDQATGEGLMLASYADGGAVDFWQALVKDADRERQLSSALGREGLEEIRRQLSQMHGVEVPLPTDGLFINWTRSPFGGGWHNWQPGWKSWETTVSMRQPVDDCPLFVCGEAYSQAQGWTEGALESAEALLQQAFGLAAPGWLAANDSQPEPAVPHQSKE
jgi:monoamine oxidase